MKANRYNQFTHCVLFACLVVVLSVSRWPAIAQAEAVSKQALNPTAASAVSNLTYQGHTFFESGFNTIVLDNAGNIYAVGTATSTWGSPLHIYSGGKDIAVMKFNSQGVYQWHTFYGAAPTEMTAGDDVANRLVVDGDGNVYLTGYSDTTWDADSEPPLHAHNGNGDNMFVLKLNANGVYQWHTFYQTGRAYAIAMDSGRNLYITGISYEGFAGWVHGTGPNGSLVILKFNDSGALQWHSYYGDGIGDVDIVGYNLATDSADNVVITGPSTSNWLGDNNTPPLHPLTSGESFSDIAILKLDSDGVYQWHTFYGGSGTDIGYAITASGEDIYVVGGTEGTWGSPLHPLTGSKDIAVLKLDGSGLLQWNTFYGSNDWDGGGGICVDASGDIYISGVSTGSWMGAEGQAPRHAYSGGYDSVVLKLDSSGTYQQHTFYGSSVNDYTGSIVLGSGHEIYLTGTSLASWQGDGDTAPIHPHSGDSVNGNGYILKLFDSIPTYIPFVRR